MSTQAASSTRRPRTAHPYRDLDVIDRNAPRTNQAVIGSLALVALLTGAEWLVALLAAQLVIGLTFGRQYCLPCLFYFEVLQPRLGEGQLEDSRPPRFANKIGAGVLGAAALLFVLGVPTAAWILTGLVSALALLAATTGFCVGCAIYSRVWGCESCA
jgi:ribosomal protein S26